MKKKNILNLIKYYSEKDDSSFRNEAYEIARDFDKTGDYQLAEYIMALLSEVNTFVPQMNEYELAFFRKIDSSSSPLPLPEKIKDAVIGIVNAIGHNVGVNKFLFEGAPGTGKTETVKQIARILSRELYQAEFDSIIDSKLGQTSKNLTNVFREINNLPHPESAIILFDEIDALALDRMNNNDLREMGRATSTLLKELDNLNNKIVFIATTNLYKSFDKALTRRFDSVINFNQYTKEDLIEVSESILGEILSKFPNVARDIKLFRKIMSILDPMPYPGDLKNLIKTSLAFSNANNKYDYLVRLYESITKSKIDGDIKKLQDQGFTVREIENLTGISKSQVSRGLNNE
ncbi:MAG: ATP-binding protein [Oscillospiraceae bacterium]|nr:ATP-binding protein [Oscillospiraceae bacterium]